MFSAALLTLLSLSSVAHSHFNLIYPTTLGFDDDNEGNGPCGGFDIVVNSSAPALTVDSFPLELVSIHPAASYLIRASTDTVAPFTWTNLLPVVNQVGLGAFCLPNVKIPSSFAGKAGVVQIMQDAVDGILYQCAIVNFVTGSNSSVSDSCHNATGVSGSLTTLTSFPGVAGTTSSGNASATGSPTATGSAPAASTSKSAAGQLAASLGAVGVLLAAGLSVL